MRFPVAAAFRPVRPLLAVAAVLALAACATGNGPSAPPTSAPGQSAPLAAPPSSMMTPHGY